MSYDDLETCNEHLFFKEAYNRETFSIHESSQLLLDVSCQSIEKALNKMLKDSPSILILENKK